MPGPDITVAICTHDNAKMLNRTLRVLSRQRVAGARWELLVVDNRCSDRTPEVLARWQASGDFPRMRVVREERLGLSNARRAAIRASSAPLIAFIDDDCFLQDGWIQAAVEFARAHPRAGAFGGEVRIRWDSPPTELGARNDWLLARQLLGPRPVRLPERAGAPLVGAGLVIRRTALVESRWVERAQFMGRTGKSLTSGDDAEISFRIRSAGWELWYTPEMKINHVLAAWRSEPRYLRRLHYAVGLTLPYIWLLSGLHERTPFLALKLATISLFLAARYALSAMAYQLRGRVLRAQERWLHVQLELGVVRGALALPPEEDGALASAGAALEPAITQPANIAMLSEASMSQAGGALLSCPSPQSREL